MSGTETAPAFPPVLAGSISCATLDATAATSVAPGLEHAVTAPLFGGAASLSPRDHRRLTDGLRRLFNLGMRPTAEFVLAVAHGGLDVREMFDELDKFASLDLELLRVTGGDQVSLPQLREVPQ